MFPRISAGRIDKEGILFFGPPTNTLDRKLISFAMGGLFKGIAMETSRFLHSHARRDYDLSATLVTVLATEQKVVPPCGQPPVARAIFSNKSTLRSIMFDGAITTSSKSGFTICALLVKHDIKRLLDVSPSVGGEYQSTEGIGVE